MPKNPEQRLPRHGRFLTGLGMLVVGGAVFYAELEKEGSNTLVSLASIAVIGVGYGLALSSDLSRPREQE